MPARPPRGHTRIPSWSPAVLSPYGGSARWSLPPTALGTQPQVSALVHTALPTELLLSHSILLPPWPKGDAEARLAQREPHSLSGFALECRHIIEETQISKTG